MTRDYFVVGGCGPRLSYVTHGEGPAVIFQHGLGADASQPFHVFPKQDGFSMVTLECRGHGRSELGPIADVSIATFASDLNALLESSNIEPFAVGGISLGAAVALRYALQHQDRISGLILARPGWLLASAPSNLRVFSEIGDLLATSDPKEALEQFSRSGELARIGAISPDNVTSLTKQFSAPDAQVRAALLRRIAVDGPRVERTELSKLRVPTLVIGNAMDAIHPIEYAQGLADLIPNAAFHSITAKSLSVDRYTCEFRDLLATFLRGLSK